MNRVCDIAVQAKRPKFEDLPIGKLFAYLPAESLAVMQCVSKKFNSEAKGIFRKD
jgi:hypothetical protein